MNINFNPNRGIASSFQNQMVRSLTLDAPIVTIPSPVVGPSIVAKQRPYKMDVQSVSGKISSPSECRDLCGDNGVKEYNSNTKTEVNVGFLGSKNWGVGFGVNGSRENNNSCVCYPPQPSNNCSLSK
ncbi:MAG: hypothetical protein ACON35_02235 [Candidatus Marinamargulisbacteria bacterium]